MIFIALKENGCALAIQGLQTLESEAAVEIGTGLTSNLVAALTGERGRVRRIPRPIHLNELGNISRQGAEPNAHDAAARGTQFHGREQIHERSRLTRQFGATHSVFAGREARQRRESERQKRTGENLVSELQPLPLARTIDH
jgi:hypothetical protein